MPKRRALGIDISKWQGEVDFSKARKAGASFVYVKASQNQWTDEQFKRSWSEAKNNGLLRGAYHFYDMRSGSASPRFQAEYFADLLAEDMGELRPALDFESPGVNGYPELPDNDESISIVTKFLQVFYEKTNVYPLVYTNLAGIKRLSPLSSFLQTKELWIAWYNIEKHNPNIGTWPTWRIWQYKASGNGKAFGVETNGLDMDAFNGTEEDLYNYANTLGISREKLTLRKTKGMVDTFLQSLPR